MSVRTAKVNELLKREVGKIILSDINFPKSIFATVIRTKTSVDLHYVDVFVSVFPTDRREEAMKILNENIYHIQQKINKKLLMKPVPKIRFKSEKSGEYVEKIDKLIEKSKCQRK